MKYLIYEERASDGVERPDLVLLEVWESQAALDHHHKQDYLGDTHKALEKENLVVKEEVIKVVDLVWGFEGR